MSTPPCGPESPRPIWTCADTERWLITAFRALPYTAIYAPRGNTLRTIDPNKPDRTFDIVAFTGTVLGDRSRSRLILLLWARVMASRGTVGGSIAEYCRESDIQRRTFDRIRIQACAEVTAAKKRADASEWEQSS